MCRVKLNIVDSTQNKFMFFHTCFYIEDVNFGNTKVFKAIAVNFIKADYSLFEFSVFDIRTLALSVFFVQC